MKGLFFMSSAPHQIVSDSIFFSCKFGNFIYDKIDIQDTKELKFSGEFSHLSYYWCWSTPQAAINYYLTLTYTIGTEEITNWFNRATNETLFLISLVRDSHIPNLKLFVNEYINIFSLMFFFLRKNSDHLGRISFTLLVF